MKFRRNLELNLDENQTIFRKQGKTSEEFRQNLDEIQTIFRGKFRRRKTQIKFR